MSGALPLWSAAALAGGVLGMRLAWSAPTAWGAVLAGLLGLALLARPGGVARARRPALRTLLAGVALAVVVAGLAGVRDVAREHGPLLELARRGGAEPVTGVVVSEPQRGPQGWWALVRVERVGAWRTRERALLRGDGALPVLGGSWAGVATARPLDTSGFEGFLRRRHATVALRPADWRRVAAPGPLAAASEVVRARIRTAADRWLPDAEAGLATGLVTGDTRLLPDPDEQAMRATGLTHLVAVSGSNVAIVAAGTLAALAVLGAGAATRRWTLLAVFAGFAFLTRFDPSVLRATTMAVIALLAGWRGHLGDGRHALAGALLLLLLVDPYVAGSLGLLLSAAATGGVLVLGPYVERRLRRWPRPLARPAALTVGAQVAVAPLLLTTDGGVPLASVPANLVAVPAAAIASIFAGLAALAALAHPVLAAVPLGVARAPLAVVLGVAHVGADAGPVIHPGLSALLVAVTAGVAWLLAHPRSRAARLAAAVLALASIAALLPAAGLRSPPTALTVTAIDVGQGDALLVETPGATVLVDAGPDETAARWLGRRGVGHVDLAVVSHPHLDHVGGMPEVLRGAAVDTLWWRPVPTELPAVDEVRALTREQAVETHEPVLGERARIGELLLEVLGPPPGRPYRDADSEANDTSVVLRASWRGRTVLLTGDIERAAQADLLRRPDLLRADVLKVPHHGSATSSPAFLVAAGAEDAVISVGADNPFGHPHPAVLDVLARSGARIRRTDQAGDVRLRLAAATPALGERQPAARASEGAGRPSLRSPHGRPRARLPALRRRRAPAASRDRTGVARRPGDGRDRGRRARCRAPRRGRARGPPGPAHRLALRR